MAPETFRYVVIGLWAVVVLCSIVLVVKGISKGGFSLKGGRPLFRARSDDEHIREYKTDFFIGVILVIILVAVTQCPG